MSRATCSIRRSSRPSFLAFRRCRAAVPGGRRVVAYRHAAVWKILDRGHDGRGARPIDAPDEAFPLVLRLAAAERARLQCDGPGHGRSSQARKKKTASEKQLRDSQANGTNRRQNRFRRAASRELCFCVARGSWVTIMFTVTCNISMHTPSRKHCQAHYSIKA